MRINNSTRELVSKWEQQHFENTQELVHKSPWQHAIVDESAQKSMRVRGQLRAEIQTLWGYESQWECTSQWELEAKWDQGFGLPPILTQTLDWADSHYFRAHRSYRECMWVSAQTRRREKFKSCWLLEKLCDSCLALGTFIILLKTTGLCSHIPRTFYQREHQSRYQEWFLLSKSCQSGLLPIFQNVSCHAGSARVQTVAPFKTKCFGDVNIHSLNKKFQY